MPPSGDAVPPGRPDIRDDPVRGGKHQPVQAAVHLATPPAPDGRRPPPPDRPAARPKSTLHPGPEPAPRPAPSACKGTLRPILPPEPSHSAQGRAAAGSIPASAVPRPSKSGRSNQTRCRRLLSPRSTPDRRRARRRGSPLSPGRAPQLLRLRPAPPSRPLSYASHGSRTSPGRPAHSPAAIRRAGHPASRKSLPPQWVARRYGCEPGRRWPVVGRGSGHLRRSPAANAERCPRRCPRDIAFAHPRTAPTSRVKPSTSVPNRSCPPASGCLPAPP